MPSMSSLNVSNIVFSSLVLFAITAIILVFKKKKRVDYVRVAKVSKLVIYPIKSLAGIEVNQLNVTKSGLRCGPFRDRSWMLVNSDNRFITQRTETSLALLKTSIHDNELWIDGPNLPTLKLTVSDEKKCKNGLNLIQTKVWGETIQGVYCGKEAEQWFSNFLQKPGIKLIEHIFGLQMRGSSAERNQKVTKLNKFPIAFQDGSGVLVINQNSINHLNEKLSNECKVSHRNFRPNVLVTDCQPYEEDNWKYLQIGNIDFTFLKPCERCVFTTINPETGQKNGTEPLTTLKTYRLANENMKKFYGSSPLFGINFGPENEGLIRCGDDILAVNH